jgi:hypothetical protein
VDERPGGFGKTICKGHGRSERFEARAKLEHRPR